MNSINDGNPLYDFNYLQQSDKFKNKDNQL